MTAFPRVDRLVHLDNKQCSNTAGNKEVVQIKYPATGLEMWPRQNFPRNNSGPSFQISSGQTRDKGPTDDADARQKIREM